MAKANTEIQKVNETSTEIALPAMDFAADSGGGMEGAGAESFAIPFLTVLQKGSPQVDEASGVALEGAKSGMLYDTVTGKLFDGKTTGVPFVPCAYKRVFIHWGPREGAGGGFKGELTGDAIAQMRAAGKIVEFEGRLYAPLPDGSVNEKKCDRFSDTRNHYGMMVDESTGAFTPVLLSLTSTQIKKSKMLMSLLAGVKLKGSAGYFTPATYANQIRITTVPESNDKGTWHGVRFELQGQVARADLYEAAKAFNASVAKGAVAANYESAEDAAPAPGAGF